MVLLPNNRMHLTRIHRASDAQRCALDFIQ